MPLVIDIDEEGNEMACVDGSHAGLADGRGNSGLFATIGLCTMIHFSNKLGLNTNSSIETEILSNGERFPKCFWFICFRLPQGDCAKEDMILQYNKTSIILQNNHPFSTRKGTKHANERYYFAVDKVKKKEFNIKCCPTEKMLADHSTKHT